MNHVIADDDRLQRLEQLVPLCESIRKGSEYRAALAQAATEVRRAASVAERLESLEPALRLLKGTPYLSAADLAADLEKLIGAGHSLERCVNTDALMDARFSVKDICEAVQRLEAHISKAWSARVHAEFVPLQRLGVVLSEIPDTMSTGLDLKTWAARAIATAGGAPTADSVMQFEQAQTERATRLEALGKLGIDAAVSSFLLEVANKQATLARLTPKVLEWLRAKNAHARFRIELT
jgi:hypothetical protein